MVKLPDFTAPIPTAPDARRDAEYAHQRHLDEQRKSALNLIHEAIHAGAFQVNIVTPLPAGLINELQSKGYQISKPFESDYAEYSVTVRW
ncbi:hypothetical protein Q0M94_28355 (plasmid) [Deinococcus radiomollis]|uniref:hypothetical protein n=1 Tax=Deinococcus radiomollis TaxID=468916 RepID=UPI0038917765